MQFFFPDNVFSRILFNNLPEEDKNLISFKESAALSMEVRKDPSSIALMPVSDIITNKDFFVSSSLGISFEESLCNSCIYYNSEEETINEFKLAGDISTLEAIIGLIFFKENYELDFKMNIALNDDELNTSDHILTGDKNFIDNKYERGISFAEEIIELISAPFVNYVLASGSDKNLKKYSDKFSEAMKNLNKQDIVIPGSFSEETKSFIKENLPSVIYNLDEQDQEGIRQIVSLPFYHGIIKDMIDIKFV
jgi:predicted solute-binding protein